MCPGRFRNARYCCRIESVLRRRGVLRDDFGNAIEDVVSPAAAKVMNMNWGMPVQKDAFLLWLGEV